VAESITLDRLADLSGAARDELRTLSLAVYPPVATTDWPGRHVEWAPAEWCVRIHEGGTLVSYVGITLREALRDGTSVRVGGIGGVKTHPAARERGLAARGMERAHEFFRDQSVGFGLLVCEARLLDYYTRLGWRAFDGRLLVRQRDATVEFTFNRVMTCAVGAAAPENGTIDLQGPPW
jgi:aminoglycoside 2'-N-acetyltransferase I